MATLRIRAERFLPAPPERVYRCIADYREHHPRFLPPAFSNFRVEQGGVGAGTVIRFQLKAGGRTLPYHGHVTEPEPGRVLAETYADGGVTTFTVTPEGSGSRVGIETTAEARGIQGVVARLLAPRLLRPLFTDELARLDQYTQAQV
jgi:uncharacterized protein YndB with AHSA1/START domain